MESNSNKLVYTTTSLSEVSFDRPTQMTVRPKHKFTDGTTYYIRFAFNCNPDGLADKILWSFEVIGGHA